MSEKSLRKLVKQMKCKPDPRLEPDDRLMLLFLADRGDDDGKFIVDDQSQLYEQIASEMNAVRARMRGDHTFAFGIDNDRVNRVLAAFRELEEE